MELKERFALVNAIGFSIGHYHMAVERGEWPLARMHLNKVVAGIGMLAMEIDEHDPVEREEE